MTQEEISIKYVMKHEKFQGRKPVDVSKQHRGYDIHSGRRYIEVKSRPGNKIQPFVTLHNHFVTFFRKGLANYYIYVVYDMNKASKLVIIPPAVIFKNLETNVSLFVRRKVYNGFKRISLEKF